MPRQKAKTVKYPTEVTIEYLIPLYIVVRNDGDGARIAKMVVDDEATSAPLRHMRAPIRRKATSSTTSMRSSAKPVTLSSVTARPNRV
jgi:hypothetical protein